MNYYKLQIMGIALFAHVFGVWGFYHLFTQGGWEWLAYGWAVGYLIAFSVEAGWHRLITHRSYETNVFWERLMGFIGMFNGEGSPIRWAAIHRQHHMHSDDMEKDPHPFGIGWFKIWTLQHNEPKIDRRVVVKTARDRAWKDPFFKFLDVHWFKFHVVTIGILAMFGWHAVTFLYAIPILMNHIGTVYVVNYIGHLKGHWGSYRPHNTKDLSVNTPWIHFPYFSPAVNHNTHHAKPNAWNIAGEKWWEFDVYAPFVNLIRKKV